jgi:hypothetical protein
MVNPPPLWPALTGTDWFFVLLNCAIVFGIIGPKLLVDIRGWIAPKKSP